VYIGFRINSSNDQSLSEYSSVNNIPCSSSNEIELFSVASFRLGDVVLFVDVKELVEEDEGLCDNCCVFFFFVVFELIFFSTY